MSGETLGVSAKLTNTGAAGIAYVLCAGSIPSPVEGVVRPSPVRKNVKNSPGLAGVPGEFKVPAPSSSTLKALIWPEPDMS
jgi:hypothetical protein